MCSNLPESFEKLDAAAVIRGSFCVKCKTEPPTTRIRHADYCDSCFMESVAHKFRASIGKMQSLLTRRGCGALVAYSGGENSRALIQLAYEFCFNVEDINRRRFGKLVICHVDCSALEDSVDIKRWQSDMRDKYSLAESVNVPLETLFQNDRQRLLQAFESCKTVEAKQELKRQFIQQCLNEAAENNGCEVIFVGETSTRVAIKTLTMVSQGRGFTLPLHTAPEVQLKDNVFLMRPLKDHLSKEVRIYSQNLKITGHADNSLTKWPSDATSRNSVRELTEKFIFGLDEEYPSTVSTVVRTASKLQFLGNATEQSTKFHRCMLCNEKIQPGIECWKSNNTLYELMSCTSLTNQSSAPSKYCYSCKNVIDSMDEKDANWPEYVKSRMVNSEDADRASIQEFLLESDAEQVTR